MENYDNTIYERKNPIHLRSSPFHSWKALGRKQCSAALWMGNIHTYKSVVITAVRREHEKWQQEEIPCSGSEKVERKKA